MDIDRYLDRIGMKCEGRVPDQAFLDELICAHQLHVPFETIDVYDFHKVPSLEVDDLFDKVVVRRRGGYCFELNALFSALLAQLGYDVWPCRFRVSSTGEPGPTTHRGTIVRIEGESRYVDVGLGGPMPSFSLSLDGTRQSARGETYWVEPAADGQLLLRRLKSTTNEDGQPGELREATMGIFDPTPVSDDVFVEPNYRLSGPDDTPFRRMRQANMRITDGHCTIAGDTYSETHGGVRTEMPIDALGGLYEVLASKFGIVIPELCENGRAS